MDPFLLTTPRLVLDQPSLGDVADMTAYCREPVFERFMATPWPYEPQHAETFIRDVVPAGWTTGDEWNWAIRRVGGGPLLGVIGIRLRNGMIGYWLGAPHRGHGIMSEAARAVVDAVFARSDRESVHWECVVGNSASVRVAQRIGFSYTGEAPGLIPSRTGESRASWTGELRRGDSRDATDGWPA